MSSFYKSPDLISQEMADVAQIILMDDITAGDTLGELIVAVMAARRAHAAIIRSSMGCATPEMIYQFLNELDVIENLVQDMLGTLLDDMEEVDNGPGLQHTGETVPDKTEIHAT